MTSQEIDEVVHKIYDKKPEYLKKDDPRLIDLFRSFGNLPAGKNLTPLVKIERSGVKNFLQNRYSNAIARKILSVLKFPK
jgi:hypothetical protein